MKYFNNWMLGISFVGPPTIISSCFSLHLVFPYLPLLFVFLQFFFALRAVYLLAGYTSMCVPFLCHMRDSGQLCTNICL